MYLVTYEQASEFFLEEFVVKRIFGDKQTSGRRRVCGLWGFLTKWNTRGGTCMGIHRGENWGG